MKQITQFFLEGESPTLRKLVSQKCYQVKTFVQSISTLFCQREIHLRCYS